MRLLDLRGMGPVEILRCAAKDFMADEMPTYASALAFQMLFSLFPFLLFLIALIGFLDLQRFFDWLQQQAALLLPAQAMDTVNAVIAQFQTERVGLFSVGILAALWTASAGVRSTMLAMNKAYDVKEGRPAWKRIPLSLLYTIGIALMLLSAAALMLVGPEVMGWLAGWVGLEQLIVILWTWLRWPLAVLLLILVVATIYYVAPDVEQRFHFLTPGSVLAVLVWIAASLGFGFYVRNFANYDATYGSVGAIIVMLLYFFISAAVLLFGAEMNAVIEHRHPEGKDPGEKQL
ncbi:YihY/virulence factor BrkB family protein [Azotobacter chroococcum]|nr:YihY/virulence factor BrkB family protein [Azotobacter chroococcum]